MWLYCLGLFLYLYFVQFQTATRQTIRFQPQLQGYFIDHEHFSQIIVLTSEPLKKSVNRKQVGPDEYILERLITVTSVKKQVFKTIPKYKVMI